MRREKVVDLGSLTVRVRELTVGDLRNLLKNDTLKIDVISFLRDGSGLPYEVIHVFTDLDRGKIEAMSFSEIKAVLDGIKEVNSDFFAVIETLGTFAGFMEGAAGTAGESLPPSSTSSSDYNAPATRTSPLGA